MRRSACLERALAPRSWACDMSVPDRHLWAMVDVDFAHALEDTLPPSGLARSDR